MAEELPEKVRRKPCVRGLRIAVQDVLEYLAGGMTPDRIVADFPGLTVQGIGFCLAFAADPERKRNPLSPLQIWAGG